MTFSCKWCDRLASRAVPANGSHAVPSRSHRDPHIHVRCPACRRRRSGLQHPRHHAAAAPVHGGMTEDFPVKSELPVRHFPACAGHRQTRHGDAGGKFTAPGAFHATLATCWQVCTPETAMPDSRATPRICGLRRAEARAPLLTGPVLLLPPPFEFPLQLPASASVSCAAYIAGTGA